MTAASQATPPARSLTPVALLLGAWTSAAAAVYLLYHARNAPLFWDVATWSPFNTASPIPGVLLVLIASMAMAWCTHVPTPRHRFTTPLPANVSRLTACRWGAALGASGMATAVLTTADNTRVTPPLALALWLAGILLIIADPGLLEREAWRSRWRQLRSSHVEWALLALLCVVAFALRSINLELYPYSMINDEAEVALSGRCLLSVACGNSNLFSTGWAAHPVLSFVTTAVSEHFFGNTAFAARLPNAILGTGAIVATYLFARRAFARDVAIVAAILLTALPVHVHFSRLALINVSDSLFSAGILWLLLRAIETGSANTYVWAGALSGLALYGYQGGRLSLALGLGTVGWALASIPGFRRRHAVLLGGYFVALLVVALPLIGYFVRTPDDFMARIRLESLYHNGSITAQTPLARQAAILTGGFFRTSLAFVATPASGGFFHGAVPHLPPIAAAAFIIGLGVVASRLREVRRMVLFAWFWTAVLASTFTSSPPTHQRMLNGMPALVIITALGMVTTVEQLRGRTARGRLTGGVAIAALLTLVTCQNLRTYFVDYNHAHRWEDVRDELPYEAGRRIAALGVPVRVYVIGAPLVYRVFGNFDFFAPGVEKTDFNLVTAATVAALPTDKDALFIAAAHRRSDLEQVARLRPGGTWQEYARRKQPGQTLYFAYHLPASQVTGSRP